MNCQSGTDQSRLEPAVGRMSRFRPAKGVGFGLRTSPADGPGRGISVNILRKELANVLNRFWILTLSCSFLGMACDRSSGADNQAPLTFSGGHETDRRDGGRPVVLVAAGLGVTPEVFREAFRGVTPSKKGPPSREEARKNKDALMRVLAPHGITNDRLDEVSNYYRYQPQRGELWTHSEAKGHAIIEGGKVKEIVMTDAGSGYSSIPTVTVKGHPNLKLKVTIHFDQELKKNGSIETVSLDVPGKKK